MIDEQKINLLKDKLVEAYQPLKIYLFGSYAWGKPTDESDLDFLIVVSKPQQASYEGYIKGYRALRGSGVSKDLLVVTDRAFEESSSDVSTLCYKTKHEGKLLYEKP